MDEVYRNNALATVGDLTVQIREMEHLTQTAVAQAVHWGATWRQIAVVLDVTPQAAHKRFRRLRYDPGTGHARHEPPLPF